VVIVGVTRLVATSQGVVDELALSMGPSTAQALLVGEAAALGTTPLLVQDLGPGQLRSIQLPETIRESVVATGAIRCLLVS
jgi:hypothetical protein